MRVITQEHFSQSNFKSSTLNKSNNGALTIAELTLLLFTSTQNFSVWFTALELMPASNDKKLLCLAHLDGSVRTQLDEYLLIKEVLTVLFSKNSFSNSIDPWICLTQCKQRHNQPLILYAAELKWWLHQILPDVKADQINTNTRERFINGLIDSRWKYIAGSRKICKIKR